MNQSAVSGYSSSSNEGSRYEVPPAQIIHIHQVDPNIPVSLPLLQRYYVNMNSLNTEYAYLKCLYFDFPIADSIKNIIGYAYEFTLTAYFILQTPDGSTHNFKGASFNFIVDHREDELNLSQLGDKLSAAITAGI